MSHYKRYGRHELPWRKTSNPYAILVSEVMLQQTQVDRVIPFYLAFLKAFPTVKKLAGARAVSVLKVWQGLGYNRRALMLQGCAKAVVSAHGGVLPADYEILKTLPGVGPYTAGAVMVFAFNKPYSLIETNIRRTYIYHFFPRASEVSDERIAPLVEQTMNRRDPKTWFGALMDYGSWLSKEVPNPNRRSKRYTKQSPFEGSDRQVRGAVLRHLLAGPITMTALFSRFDISKRRFRNVLQGLVNDGFVKKKGSRVSCA